MSTLYTMVAPCFFGTESTLNFEVKRLGAQNIQVTDGRVAFQGGADVVAAANLNLRTAERVLLLLATYKATTFDELFDGCYNIAWEVLHLIPSRVKALRKIQRKCLMPARSDTSTATNRRSCFSTEVRIH